MERRIVRSIPGAEGGKDGAPLAFHVSCVHGIGFHCDGDAGSQARVDEAESGDQSEGSWFGQEEGIDGCRKGEMGWEIDVESGRGRWLGEQWRGIGWFYTVRGSRYLWDEQMVGNTVLQKYLFRDITGISIGYLFVCKTQEWNSGVKVENWIQSGNDVLRRIIIEMKKEKEKSLKGGSNSWPFAY